MKYNNVVVFLILESIALYLLTTGNNYHNTKMVKGIKGLTAGIEARVNNARTFFNLRDINFKLAEENARLMNLLARSGIREESGFSTISDSVYGQQYKYTSAEVIGNSVNKQKNYFTINKGRNQGIDIDMAVTNNQDVVGAIVGCSENFAVAISLLNIDFRLSARIKSNGYFGSLNWDGRNYREAVLNEIPQHIEVNIGDTVETTGYSAIFPEGILVGTVSDRKRSGSDFYKITVKLFNDFKKLHDITIIGNMKKTEQIELESRFQ